MDFSESDKNLRDGDSTSKYETTASRMESPTFNEALAGSDHKKRL
jgi:hypothetical protein